MACFLFLFVLFFLFDFATKEKEKDILKNFLFENNSYFFFFEKARRKSFLLHLQASKYNDQLEMFTPKKKKL